MRPVHGLLLVAMLAAGCARERSSDAPSSSARAPASDSAVDRPRDASLPAAPPEAFALPPPTRLRIAKPAAGARVPPPDAAMAEPPPPEGAVDRLPMDDALHPPVLREGSRAALPRRARGWVELDLLVDAQGEVVEVRPAGGTADAATTAEAIATARALRYVPARQAGRAVAVWCRQRFE